MHFNGDKNRKKLVVTMREKDMGKLIERCQEKDAQGWDYVHPIKKETVTYNESNYRYGKKAKWGRRKVFSDTVFVVTMFKENKDEVNNEEVESNV